MMNAYPVAPPPPPRRRFPFIATGLLLAFATVCALTVIGAGAAAFVVVRASGPTGNASQTGELFLVHMAAGRYGDASRLVAPEYAGAVAGLGETRKETWGENRGCSRMSSHSGLEGGECGIRMETRATMEYDVKGTDGAVRKVRMKVLNGLIQGLAIDGEPVLGNVTPGDGIIVGPAPVRVAPEAKPVETEAPAKEKKARK